MYDCHELNYKHIALSRLQISDIYDFTIQIVQNSP